MKCDDDDSFITLYQSFGDCADVKINVMTKAHTLEDLHVDFHETKFFSRLKFQS